MKKTKILYIHHAIGLGGAPKSLSFLISGLDPNRFEPYVCMPKRPGNEAVVNMFADAGAQVIEEKDVRPFNGSTVAECSTLKDRAYAVLSYRSTVACAKKVTNQINPDIVHLNSTCIVAAAKGAHQANPSTPVIAHVREPLLQNWWGRMLARMNLRHVDHFISIDKYGLQSIGGDARERGDVVYNFVDRNKFYPDPSKTKAIEGQHSWNGKTVFLSLSRIAKFNGTLKLAQMIESLGDRVHPDAHFVFAGFHQPHDEYSKQTAAVIDRLNNCSRLEFVPDPVSLLQSISVVVAPFLTPHSARSVFEGAAVGKPALVSNLPNLQELIMEGTTGLSFDFNAPSSFVDAVEQLSDPKVREDFGDAAAQFAMETFDQQTNVAKIISIYENLLSCC